MQTEAGDLNGCWTNNFDRPWNMYNQDYILENYGYMDSLFEKAYALAKTGSERNHIELTRMHVDFLGLSATFERDYTNGDEASKALYAQKHARLYNTIVNNNVNVTALGLNGRGCEVFPTSESNIRCPMNWIFEGFTGYWVYRNGGWV